MIGLVWLALAVFSYCKGYSAFRTSGPGMTGAWAVCSAISIFCLIRRIRNMSYLTMRIEKIDQLSGEGFEQYLTAQFRRLGYRVSQTGASHDYGADLLLKKHGKTIVVQAKRYENNVGLSAVQQAVGAVAYYQADQAMVVTNRYFTKSAVNLARQNDVELWDRNEIRRRFRI